MFYLLFLFVLYVPITVNTLVNEFNIICYDSIVNYLFFLLFYNNLFNVPLFLLLHLLILFIHKRVSLYDSNLFIFFLFYNNHF